MHTLHGCPSTAKLSGQGTKSTLSYITPINHKLKEQISSPIDQFSCFRSPCRNNVKLLYYNTRNAPRFNTMSRKKKVFFHRGINSTSVSLHVIQLQMCPDKMIQLLASRRGEWRVILGDRAVPLLLAGSFLFLLRDLL
jgi:hypothetical protein